MTELSDYLYLDHDTCYMLLLAIYNMDDHMAERISNARPSSKRRVLTRRCRYWSG